VAFCVFWVVVRAWGKEKIPYKGFSLKKKWHPSEEKYDWLGGKNFSLPKKQAT